MKREYPRAPIFGVGAVIMHNSRVLVARRAHPPLKGHWTLPGGAVELGETTVEAIVREVAEETGLIVDPIALVEVVDRIDRDGSRIRFHYIIVDFLCHVTGGVLRAASDADGVEWLRPSEWRSAKRNLDPVTLRVIEKAWRMHREQSQKGKR